MFCYHNIAFHYLREPKKDLHHQSRLCNKQCFTTDTTMHTKTGKNWRHRITLMKAKQDFMMNKWGAGRLLPHNPHLKLKINQSCCIANARLILASSCMKAHEVQTKFPTFNDFALWHNSHHLNWISTQKKKTKLTHITVACRHKYSSIKDPNLFTPSNIWKMTVWLREKMSIKDILQQLYLKKKSYQSGYLKSFLRGY